MGLYMLINVLLQKLFLFIFPALFEVGGEAGDLIDFRLLEGPILAERISADDITLLIANEIRLFLLHELLLFLAHRLGYLL